MRADRLVAALLLLQQKGRLTAAELAGELDVSVPTARRDLEALSASGIPVYPQAGRGGGWQLVGGARTDLTGLTAGEARSLFLLLGPGGRADPDARTALRKLARALPAPFRDEALAAADAVVHDPAGWGEQQAVSPADHVRRTLQDAVVRRRRVDLTYAAPTGSQSVRLVDPWGLAAKDGRWYLVAGTDAGRRTFRLDRVVVADVLDAQATRPADLDLGAEWDQVVTAVEERRAGLWADLLVAPDAVPMLRRTFGRHTEVAQARSDGVPARVAGLNADVLARRLASFGGSVRVLGPPEVRERLLEVARGSIAAQADSGATGITGAGQEYSGPRSTVAVRVHPGPGWPSNG